jgi:hypothetical protein
MNFDDGRQPQISLSDSDNPYFDFEADDAFYDGQELGAVSPLFVALLPALPPEIVNAMMNPWALVEGHLNDTMDGWADFEVDLL